MTIELNSIDDYKERVPSIFTEKPSPKTSTKYNFANTYELCKEIENNGWKVYSAFQCRTNKNSSPSEKLYTNHIVTFRKESYEALKVDDLIPTMYLSNSHNGSSTLKLNSGLHRVVCSNGLVTPMKDFANLTISHHSNRIKEIKQFLENYMDNYSNLGQTIKSMQEIELNDADRLKFATMSMSLRFSQDDMPKFEVDEILEPLRVEDNKKNLWSVYNVVQERLSKGLFKTIKPIDESKIKIRKGRNLDNQFRYVDFNNKIWNLAKSKVESNDFQIA